MNLIPEAIPTYVLAIALFWLGYLVAERAESRTARIVTVIASAVLAIPAFLFALYYVHFFDRAQWFYEFRSLPHVELLESGAAVLGGVVQRLLRPESLTQKIVLPIATAGLMFVPFLKSALDPVDYERLQTGCEEEVCLQSTQSTCGPASAATLLRMLGRSSSEKELARECFTYRGGTEVWYIARALRRRGLKAQFVIQQPNQIFPPAPAIAGVLLRGGVGHFVAIMDANADTVTIGDPLRGRVVIPRSELRQFYNFTGFFLVIYPRTQSQR
jgi:predicted double-glycine peptidase